VAHITKAHQPE